LINYFDPIPPLRIPVFEQMINFNYVVTSLRVIIIDQSMVSLKF